MAEDIHNLGFLRAAAAVPPLKVGDVNYNTERILEFTKRAARDSADIILFPETSLTGYTVGDLFHQRLLLKNAAKGLEKIKRFSRVLKPVIVVGLPLEAEGKLLNVAAVINQGKIHGFVPKTYIPGYKEFYEERWFASARDLRLREINFFGQKVQIGRDILFSLKGPPSAILGIEICEDLWAPFPPSTAQAVFGANIILNPSASNELVAKADYRRALVLQQSARTVSGYVYASSGASESTTDLVFGGHALIAENGIIFAESKRFQRGGELIMADLDLEHLNHDRIKTTSFGESVHDLPQSAFRLIDLSQKNNKVTRLLMASDRHPFVPQDLATRHQRAKEIFSIQAAGLAKRLEQAGIKKAVIGISGGLDSTLALLVSVGAFSELGLPLKNIRALTMPGFGTSSRTKSNAQKLCQALGIPLEEIDIRREAAVHFQEIKHDPQRQDKTFENVQARIRTMVLMNKANQLNAIVVGTGDLSELALGWNTFSGDQISHYNVNAGVPKTLVRYLVGWAAETQAGPAAKKILEKILATPISPELVRNHKKEITQKTEDIIGPYELHDFFLYHFLRWGSSPRKILFLASQAFQGAYSEKEIRKWLRVFITRFFGNQWKRSVMPDGPKVGSVSLSPRGDWRMPSDAEVKMWLEDLV